LTDTRLYDAFGNLLSSTGSATTPFEYVGAYGYYNEPGVDLMLLWHRWYEEGTGRFGSRDQLEALTSPSKYIYVLNAPTAARDPLGLQPMPPEGWAACDCATNFGRCMRQATIPFGQCVRDWFLSGVVPVDLGALALCFVACVGTGPGYGACVGVCLGTVGAIIGGINIYFALRACDRLARELADNCLNAYAFCCAFAERHGGSRCLSPRGGWKPGHQNPDWWLQWRAR